MIAEFGTGQVLWSLLWFFLFLVWVMLVFRVFGDLLQDDQMSGTAKTLWTVAAVVLPYIGALAYLAVHGGRHRASTATASAAPAAGRRVDGDVSDRAGQRRRRARAAGAPAHRRQDR